MSSAQSSAAVDDDNAPLAPDSGGPADTPTVSSSAPRLFDALARRLPVVGWWAMVAATAIVPVLVVKWGSNPFSLPKLTLLLGCTTLGVAGLAVEWRAGTLPRPLTHVVPRPVAVTVAILLAVAAVSTVLSRAPWVSLFGRYSRYGGLLSLVVYVVFGFVLVATTAGRPHRLVTIGRALAFGGVIGAVYLVLQLLHVDVDWRGTIGAQDDSFRMGALGNSNFSGAHLAIVLPLVVHLRGRDPSVRARRLATAAIPLLAVGLLVSASRGAWVAALVGMAVLLLGDRSLGPRWLSLAITTLAIVGVLSVVVIAVSRQTDSIEPLPSDTVFRSRTLEQRVDIWRGAIDVLRDHPVIGTGLDTFGQSFLPYAEPELTLRPAPVDEPHNLALDYATSAGVPGLLAWSAVIVATLGVAWRSRRRVGPHRGVLVAYTAGFVAYLAQGMVSIDAVPLAFLGWTMLAATVAAANRDVGRGGGAGGEPTPAPVSPVFTFLVTMSAAVVIVLSLAPFLADVRLRAALDHPAAEALDGGAPPSSLLDEFDAARTLDPFEPRIRLEAARRALDASSRVHDPAQRRVLLGEGERRADEALALLPDEVETMLIKEQILEVRASTGEPTYYEPADELMRTLERLDPHDPQVRYERAKLLQSWQRTTGRTDLVEEIRREADATRDRAHSWAYGWYMAGRLYRDVGDHDAALAATRRGHELDPGDQRITALLDELEPRQ